MSRRDLSLPAHAERTAPPRAALVRVLPVLMVCAAVWAGLGTAPLGQVALGQRPDSRPGHFARPGGPVLDGAAVMQVGAARQSLYPRPEAVEGAVWETDRDACATLSPAILSQAGQDPTSGAHLATGPNPWPENPDCLYMGGYGIGPMNPITSWDLGPDDPGHSESGLAGDGDPTTGVGLYARAVALSDGTDTSVVVVLDAEGYLWDYASKCDDCGAKQLTESLGAELGIDPAGIVISSTHSHTTMDLIGGWGFVPDWYMAQVTETIREVVRDAVRSARPAVVEIGEVQARAHNRERRETYRSAEEQQLTWLRALDADSGATIATLAAYAAHPTTRSAADGIAHADWPGVFAAQLEQRFGGVGMHAMTGLGNMSTAGGTQMGIALAGLVPAVGEGTPIIDGDVRVARRTWAQPATNVPLTALALPGFFDRAFLLEPATMSTGKTDTAPCTSAAPVAVELAASAMRIGEQFAMTAAPGEVFANLTNTIKEQSGAAVTMPLGQANDALGYMPQSFELSPVGQQGLGFVAGGVLIVNYEDSYAIDRCTGDMVLETSIAMLSELR